MSSKVDVDQVKSMTTQHIINENIVQHTTHTTSTTTHDQLQQRLIQSISTNCYQYCLHDNNIINSSVLNNSTTNNNSDNIDSTVDKSCVSKCITQRLDVMKHVNQWLQRPI